MGSTDLSASRTRALVTLYPIDLSWPRINFSPTPGSVFLISDTLVLSSVSVSSLPAFQILDVSYTMSSWKHPTTMLCRSMKMIMNTTIQVVPLLQ